MSNRGSLWNKWDFHVHTPASYHWKGQRFFEENSKENKEKNDKLIGDLLQAVVESDVSVFVIMDYWTFDGYLKIRKYIEENDYDLKGKLILPGIELRIDAPTDYRMNIHLILNPNCTNIEIGDFKSELKLLNVSRSLSNEGLIDVAYSLGPSGLSKYGTNLEKLKDNRDLAFKIGCENSLITKESFKHAVNSLADKCLVLMPWNTYGGLSKLNWKENLIVSYEFMRMADIFEARGSDEKDLINGKRTPANDKFFDDFMYSIGSVGKLSVSGTDAHKFSGYGKFSQNNCTWLKCDLSFNGLKHACIEPIERSYYGEIPPKLHSYKTNPGIFIDSIEIKKESGSELDDEWFDSKIDLNIGLVSIIGNKGSGKSALADIIGFAGNARVDENYFSFLTFDRFKKNNGKLSKNFNARLIMNPSKELDWVNLNDKISNTKFEYVKYLPQSYLEKLCNEVAISRSSDFENELKKVIFSHIDQVDRLGMNSFDELANLKIKQRSHVIDEKKTEIKELIVELLDLFAKMSEGYKNELKKKLQNSEEALVEIEKVKPIVLDNPLESGAEGSRENKVLRINNLLQARKETIKTKIEILLKKLERLTKNKFLTDKAIESVSFEKQRIASIVSGINRDLVETEMYSTKEPVKFLIEFNEVVEVAEKLKNEIEHIKKELNPEFGESLTCKEKLNNDRIEKVSLYIDDKDKEYRQSVIKMEKWDKDKKLIIGDETIVDSIVNLRKRIKESDEAPANFEKVFNKIAEISHLIFQEKIGIVNIWKELYSSVQNFSNEHSIIKKIEMKLNFEATLHLESFEENFLDYVNLKNKGSFTSTGDNFFLKKNIEMFKSKLDVDHFNKFINDIGKGVFFDMRDGEGGDYVGEKQLKKNKKIDDLLAYLFSLDYVECSYGLHMGDRKISELSPGEKGLLLLIFYILLDKQSIPLIIDQPEENLDNETIKEILVPCLLEAKQKRQVIMVTHNPNLAVVCDSEQIIFSKLEKNNKNKISYISGGIESSLIRDKIVDVLEGTMPAFKIRGDKYSDRIRRNLK